MINFINTDFGLKSIFKAKQMKNTSILCDSNLSGAVEYFKACQEKELKTIISYKQDEIYIAVNKNDYTNMLSSFSEGLIPNGGVHVLGTPFSKLANLVTKQYYPYLPEDDSFEKVCKYVEQYKKEHPHCIIYLGVSPYEGECYEALRELLRDAGRKMSLPTCLVDSVHYKENKSVSGSITTPVDDHQVVCCHRTKKKKSEYFDMPEEYKRFFLSDQYYPQDWSKFPEYASTQYIVDMCQDYDILAEPQLPHFDSASETLAEFCRVGWKEKELSKRDNWEEYRDRIKEELRVIDMSGFSAYFLVLEEVCRWIDDQGWLRGFGRGSAGGCLVSYLSNITRVDPLEYDLLFERFFSEDRAEARQLPDIDIDVPKFKRQAIFSHLQDTYGHESVAQMVTFSELQGRSSLTSVLRYNERCSFDQIKSITSLIPEKAKVEDQMDTVGEKSLLQWTLEYMPERLSNYARLEEGKIVGDFASDFEQAIRLEGIKVDTGKHASAIIVYNGKIRDVCPMIADKSSEEKITGFSMEDGEAVGLVKLDLLGLATLDKLMLVNELLEEAKNE